MKRKLIKKSIIILSVLILCLMAFYTFMTYDRTYTWAKEYSDEIKQISDSINFVVYKSESINFEDVKLPTERKVKIDIQKFLNKFGLMNYDKEYGESIILKSRNENSIIVCKSRNIGDNLIGLEIEYKNIDGQKLGIIKDLFEQKFSNYKLIWTKL